MCLPYFAAGSLSMDVSSNEHVKEQKTNPRISEAGFYRQFLGVVDTSKAPSGLAKEKESEKKVTLL
jgi:hypothetical protein